MGIKDKVNGYGVILFSSVTAFCCALLVFILTAMQADITSISDKFTLMRDNMVYKCDYASDLEITRKCFDKLEIRLNNLMVHR